MPVIRVDTTTTTTTLPPEIRASLFTKLRDEIDGKTASPEGPVIFLIPMGSECYDVLVVWKDWADIRSEDRTALILDAYGDRQPSISQALGVTYEEAMQQQLLPYAVVSTLEREPKMASLVCGGDRHKVTRLLDEVRQAKLENGGIALPDGKVELRFPNRAMAENVRSRLLADEKYRDYYWSISIEVSISDSVGL